MTRTTELLDAVKQAAGITSNYQLAKHLETPEQYISLAYQERKHADEYLATRIALALGREPIAVIAELRESDEKNPIRREFWRSFRQRAALVIALVTALNYGLPPQNAHGTEGEGVRPNDRTYNYAQRQAWRRKAGRNRKRLRWNTDDLRANRLHSPAGCTAAGGGLTMHQTGPRKRRASRSRKSRQPAQNAGCRSPGIATASL